MDTFHCLQICIDNSQYISIYLLLTIYCIIVYFCYFVKSFLWFLNNIFKNWWKIKKFPAYHFSVFCYSLHSPVLFLFLVPYLLALYLSNQRINLQKNWYCLPLGSEPLMWLLIFCLHFNSFCFSFFITIVRNCTILFRYSNIWQVSIFYFYMLFDNTLSII